MYVTINMQMERRSCMVDDTMHPTSSYLNIIITQYKMHAKIWQKSNHRGSLVLRIGHDYEKKYRPSTYTIRIKFVIEYVYNSIFYENTYNYNKLLHTCGNPQ